MISMTIWSRCLFRMKVMIWSLKVQQEVSPVAFGILILHLPILMAAQ